MFHEVTVPLWMLLSPLVTAPIAAFLGVVVSERLWGASTDRAKADRPES